MSSRILVLVLDVVDWLPMWIANPNWLVRGFPEGSNQVATHTVTGMDVRD